MVTVPFEFDCSKDAGFLMDPNEHKTVGYVTSLNGFGVSMPLAKDLTVSVPYNGSPQPAYRGVTLQAGQTRSTATVIGVVEKFSWEGGVGNPLEIDFYVSQQNATQIKAAQQNVLQSTKVQAFGWWIIGYDQEAKLWFERSYPRSTPTVAGVIGSGGNDLDVDLNPVPAKDGIDVNVYKISIRIAPGANESYSLSFANSSSKPVIKAWGLTVGSLGHSVV